MCEGAPAQDRLIAICREHLGVTEGDAEAAVDSILRATVRAAVSGRGGAGERITIADSARKHLEHLRRCLERLRTMDAVGTAATDPVVFGARLQAESEGTPDAMDEARALLDITAVQGGIYGMALADLDVLDASLRRYIRAGHDGALDTGSMPDEVAYMAARIFHGATAAAPTQNNEHPTRFTNFLNALFSALGIRQSSRHPARRAVDRFRRGPDVEARFSKSDS